MRKTIGKNKMRMAGGAALLASAAMLATACGAAKQSIDVITREASSGTRSAFVELLEITDANGNDAITTAAEITQSTAVVITTVAGDKNAIGYISLGALSDEVKAVRVDGVEATVANIENGSYCLSRPFNIAYQDGALSELAEDFVSYILSAEGQSIIENKSYIRAADGEAYEVKEGMSGKITLAGSTSVAPVMGDIADAYMALYPDVTVEIQESGSSAGITSAMEGVAEIAMSSRELKAEEAEVLTTVKIATDGIAVVVNQENSVSELTSEQIRSIFLGELTDWSEVQ